MSVRLLSFVSSAFLFALGAHAAVIAADPFLSGGSPAAGEYAPNAPIDNPVGVNPTVAGFSGAWASVTTNITGFVRSDAAGLDAPAVGGEAGGSVRYVSNGDPQRPKWG